MVDLGVDIVNVDNVVAFRSFVVSNLYQRRWRRTLGPFGLDPGRQQLQCFLPCAPLELFRSLSPV